MGKTVKLESFMKEKDGLILEKPLVKEQKKEEKSQSRGDKFIARRIEAPSNLGKSILLSVNYDGDKGLAYAKLYCLADNEIYFWYDNTMHHPYFLTDLKEHELRSNEDLMSHPGLLGFKKTRKYYLLRDRELDMVKIEAKDPLSIGGLKGLIREIKDNRTWESNIRYHHCYIMDNNLTPGTLYSVKDGFLKEEQYTISKEQSTEIKNRFKDDLNKYEELINRYLPRILDKIPELDRTALDIEVSTPLEDFIPDPETADHPVISVSLVTNRGDSLVLLYPNGQKTGERPKSFPEDVKLEFFESEKDLLCRVFSSINETPILVTFNGDNFDLRYLYYRAKKLGISEERIPIKIGDYADLKAGIHIDLYPFFNNVSIKGYAFGNRYTESTLNAISKALLKEEKIQCDRFITDLTMMELAHYCWNDSKLTMDLTKFNDELVMRLIILLMRISHLPIEDLTRTAVSAWIRNLIFYEHRQKNYLIPNQEDILKEKGEAHSQAVIKGKKFKGAIVIEPTRGVHFNVVVLDFSSLYPSIIKEYNLSYETVECPDPDCRKNILPGTDFCVCKKKVGIFSSIVGFLRDIRVDWFKIKSKDKSIPQETRDYYKVIEQALKVYINASYGVIGSETFPLYTPPVADSTTAIGRYAITRVIEKARELGVQVLYGDSVSGETKITVDKGDKLVKDLFRKADNIIDGKEYHYPKRLKALTLDGTGRLCYRKVNYIVRHKCNKKMYRVWYTDSRYIDVTEDHSLIGVYNGGSIRSPLTEKFTLIRPLDLREDMYGLVTLAGSGERTAGCDFKVNSVHKVEEIKYDDYVYDLQVEFTHTFFANDILVHNTDSVFLKDPSREQINSLIDWSVKELAIDLDVDKVYRYVALSGRKKNYLGIYENGEVDIKGLTGKKKHVPIFIQRAFSEMIEVLSSVRSEEQFEAAKNRIKDIASTLYRKLEKRQIPLSELAFKVQMSKPIDSYTKTTPQHIKAAKLIEETGREVKPGEIISFVKTRNYEGVKPLEIANLNDIDTDKYKEAIESTFDQVLDSLNIEFNEVMGIRKLSDYFA